METSVGKLFQVGFESAAYGPLELPAGSNLSIELTSLNSPVLFGCRTGICGTCLIKVRVLDGGRLDPASDDEKELLGLLCPNEPEARLACQLNLNANIQVQPLKLI